MFVIKESGKLIRFLTNKFEMMADTGWARFFG